MNQNTQFHLFTQKIGGPVLINTAAVAVVAPFEAGTMITLLDGKTLYVTESGERILRAFVDQPNQIAEITSRWRQAA